MSDAESDEATFDMTAMTIHNEKTAFVGGGGGAGFIRVLASQIQACRSSNLSLMSPTSIPPPPVPLVATLHVESRP